MLNHKDEIEIENNALRLEPISQVSVTQHSVLRRDELETPGTFQQLPIFLKTVGGDRSYAFETYELTQNAVFVICSNLKKYPFQPGSTLLEMTVKLTMRDTGEQFYFSALAKMERHFERAIQSEDAPNGFMLKIVQSNFDDRKKYDLFVESNRSAPDLLA